MSLLAFEQAWLDYAWQVVTTPEDHKRGCLLRGAARGAGMDGGNAIRYPGYVGRAFVPGKGILCLAHVHREPDSPEHVAQGEAEYVRAHEKWLAAGRSSEADTRYLEQVRSYYEVGLRGWGPWRNSFRRIIEEDLGLGVSDIAYGNFAKCRQPLGPNAMPLVEWCQRVHPASQLVAALRPAAVFTRVVAADPRRGIVDWETSAWTPLIFAFKGRGVVSPEGKLRDDWVPDAVSAIHRRWAELDDAAV